MSSESRISRREFVVWAAAASGAAGIVAFAAAPDRARHIVNAAKEKIGVSDPEPQDQTPSNSQETCIDIANGLTLEEKIGALILPMAGVQPEPGVSNGSVPELDSLETLMVERNISAFTTYNLQPETISGGKSQPVGQALVGLIGRISANRKGLPVEYALDIEGGGVKRDKALDGAPPLNSASDQAQDPLGPTAITAKITAEGLFLRGLGVTTIFGPVTDTGTEGPIGKRSYGDNTQIVETSVAAAIDGWRAAGLHVTPKHWPGHGHATADSHKPVLPSTPPFAVMEAGDMVPFADIIKSKAPDSVMIGHLVVPEFTEPGTPASLSPIAYKYLRDVEGFSGVAITDALNMGAIKVFLQDTYQNGQPMTDEAAESMSAALAIQAGADRVIVTSGAARQVFDTLKFAVAANTIPMERLHDAVARVYRGKGVAVC